MKQSKQVKRKSFTLGRWSGIFTTLIILMLIVIALVFVVIRLPIPGTSPALDATLTPTPKADDALNPLPPIVDTTGMMIMAGSLVLLVLGLVFRELTWFSRQP